MSRFDLNKPVDFARVTGQNLNIAGNLLGSLLGINPDEWDIVEASFKSNNPAKQTPVKFHIFQSNSSYQAALPEIRDSGGRRKVKYTFPYTDGQTTDDIGRTPKGFTFGVMFYGSSYLDGLKSFLNVLDDPFPGVLTHPVMGDIPCVMESYELTHQHEQRKAVLMRVTLVEHTFSISEESSSGIGLGKSLSNALGAALNAIGTVQNVLNKISNILALPQAFKNTLAGLLGSYGDNYTESAVAINTTFNTGTGGSAQNFPTLLPVNQGGTAGQSSTISALSSLSDPYQSLSISAQQAQVNPLTVAQVTSSVNTARDSLESFIEAVDADPLGLAPLLLYSDILSLKQGSIVLQEALERGIANSGAQTNLYTTTRLMSIREVTFENRLPMDRVNDVIGLNAKSLLTFNDIPEGTQLLVPAS